MNTVGPCRRNACPYSFGPAAADDQSTRKSYNFGEIGTSFRMFHFLNNIPVEPKKEPRPKFILIKMQ